MDTSEGDETEITGMMSDLAVSNEEEESQTDAEGQRKLFVGGLSWQTTEEALQNYFESLGIGIEKAIIMRDKITNRSRGFGFVTLKKVEDIDKAVNTRLHLGRRIEAKRAIPKREMDNNSRKLFVGGISISLTNVEFRKYFEKFGTVSDAQIMTERQSGHSRGFGFVTFEEDEVARTVLKARHVIQGKTVEVKKAQPKKADRQQPIHIVHPYPMPYFPHYSSMYAPIPIYGHPSIYQPPLAYDPYFMAQSGGVVYAPHYVDNGYSPYMYPRAASPMGSLSSKTGDMYTSPPMVRPLQRRRGSSLYSRLSPQTSSYSYYVTPPERTERAWSAGPSVISSTQNARKRGMSQPPIHTRSRSSTSIRPHHIPIATPSTHRSASPLHYSPPPLYHHLANVQPTVARRGTTHYEQPNETVSGPQENSQIGLHKYFQ